MTLRPPSGRFTARLCRLLVLAAITLLSAAIVTAPATAADPATVDLKRFLTSPSGTFGWEPVKAGGDGLSYDFFPDGRLHIEGKDGEATMWPGKWSVNGNQVTITNVTKKTKKTVTAKIDGHDLLLDGVRYHRYKPQ